MGIHIIKMPDIGEGIAEVELVAWHVKVGDMVAEDQILADVMTDKATVEIPSSVAGKVLEALSRCYLLDGYELLSTPSIGVVLFCQEHHTINDLLRQADMAMYEAKAAGRATFRFFDTAMPFVDPAKLVA